ncbi:MAG: transporter [Thiobacillus sp.]|nr:transporter [Thiobacillus sp.]
MVRAKIRRSRRGKIPLAAVVLIGTPLGIAPAVAAPQTFNTALPVAEDQFVARGQFLYRKIGDDPTPAGATVNVLSGIAAMGYGVTADLAVFGILPYLDKTLKTMTPDGQHIARGSSGIGDFQIFERYTVYRRDAPGRTFRIAPFVGVKMPTGDDNKQDNLGILPMPLQTGTGSWDPFGGFVMTYQTLNYQFDAQAAYKINTAANNFAFGDEARLDASIQYRLYPRALGNGTPGFFYGVIETNLVHQGKNKTNGASDPNSGGTAFFVSPGVQYVTKRWILEAIVQVPVVQDLNGTALKDDFILRAGFRVNF